MPNPGPNFDATPDRPEGVPALGDPGDVLTIGDDGNLEWSPASGGASNLDSLIGVDVTAAPHSASPSNTAAQNVTAFRSAFAAARLLGTFVFVPPGTFQVNARIHDSAASSQPIQIRGVPGKSIIARTVSTNIIDQLGSRGTAVSLSADVAAGATAVTTASLPTSLAVGDIVVVRSNVTESGNAKVAEMMMVKSITGSGPYTINFHGQFEDAYATANSSVIERYDLASGLDIRGITFKQTVVDRGDTTDCVNLTHTRSWNIVGCEFRDLDWPAIGIYGGAYNWNVDSCHFENLIDNLGANRIGYGINASYAGTMGRVHNCSSRRTRHFFTTGSAGTNGGPKNIVVSNCVGHEETAFVSTHKEGKHITFVGCHAIDNDPSAGVPFYIRNPRTTLLECRAIGWGTSAVAFAEGEAADGRLIGGTFRRSPRTGGVAAIDIKAPRIIVNGCYVEGGGTRNIDVANNGSSTGPSAQFGSDVQIINVTSVEPQNDRHINFTGNSGANSMGVNNLIQGGWFTASVTKKILLLQLETSAATRISVKGARVNANTQHLVDDSNAAAGLAVIDSSSDQKIVTSAYTIIGDDGTILVDASAGAVTITLPNSTTRRGREYTIRKVDSSTNAVTINRTSTNTIHNGSLTSLVLTTQHQRAVLRSDGSANWLLPLGFLGGGAVTKTADYALTDSDTNSLVIANAATKTMTLPDATTRKGAIFRIKNGASGTGTVLATTSSQTIDGAAPGTLASAYDKIAVISDGANWLTL